MGDDMMMSDFPADLVEEILSRVPATYLKRLRSTCKRWDALFKNQGFIKKHFRNAPKESLFLLWKDYRVRLMSVNLKVPASIDFKGVLSLKASLTNSTQIDIATVFYCDGLLLCTTKNRRVVVWNPYLGETRWIKLRFDDNRDTTNLALGYQDNKSCRTYKILRRCKRKDVVRLEIFEFSSVFSSDSWRVLDNVALNCLIRKNTGVSLKGNTYWLPSLYINNNNFLVSFDFSTERFKRLSLPPNLASRMFLSVVRDEQLSLILHQSIPSSNMEIWMTNNIGSEADLLWSKSFSVYFKIRPPYSTPICTSHFIIEEKKVVVCCHVQLHSSVTYESMVTIAGEDDEYYTEMFYEDFSPTIFNYVPSFVQLSKDKNESTRQS